MNRIVTRVYSIGLLGFFLGIVGGCSGAPSDGFKGERGQVIGKLTLDGKPLPEGCQLRFISEKGCNVGAGVTSATGDFRLRYRVNAGLPVGEYSIQIIPPLEEVPSKGIDPAKLAPIKLAQRKPSDLNDGKVFPAKYYSTATSGLSFAVKKGTNSAVFDLKKTSDKM